MKRAALLAASFFFSGTLASAAEDGALQKMEAIIRANHGTVSGHERSPQAKFCLTNVFLPGEYGDNDEIWLEFMTSAGSSFMPFPGGEWWRLEQAESRLNFRFNVHGENEFISYSFDPRTLKFRSGFIRNVRTGADGIVCEF